MWSIKQLLFKGLLKKLFFDALYLLYFVQFLQADCKIRLITGKKNHSGGINQWPKLYFALNMQSEDPI